MLVASGRFRCRDSSSGSDHDRALVHAGASDPAAARPRGERSVVLGQPLDLPLQGFALLGLSLDLQPQGLDLL